ncbi:MAG TPA: SAM-dependent chlorinase/fluorinase [Terriglobales bacterium]|nr:SAM-dependent chlorinase/fluorinase [Terriglobales bacterium]
MPATNRLITFTTDFGVTDHYVGTMKGVIHSINPEARIVDVCNSVQSFDILDGALTIEQAYGYFPSETIHMVIVDPGVGSARRPILAITARYVFIAPDNGVLSFVFAREERLKVRHITASHYFLQPVSQTFHGRDIFAAVAGHLSKGVEPEKFGEEITDFQRFIMPKAKEIAPGQIKGAIIRVDKFGNLVTNLRPEDAPALKDAARFRLTLGKHPISKLATSYSQGAANEVFLILGSMGYFEIASNRGSAARICGANRGAEFVLAIG